MGGKALLGPDGTSITSRLVKAHYTAVKTYILQRAKDAFTSAEVVLELPGKDTFGDLDVLYVPRSRDTLEYVLAEFKPRKTHISGPVLSFDFDCSLVGVPDTRFQVDFIAVDTQRLLDAARFYFSYGDVGGILGRLFNHHGIKFGQDGLWVNVLKGSVDPSQELDIRQTVGRVNLSNDPKALCEFAGLNYDEWLHAFPTLSVAEDEVRIFDWVTASRLFKPNIFNELNTEHRRRERVRPFYRRFLTHIGVDKVGKCKDCGAGEICFGNNMQMEAVRYFGKEAVLADLLQDMTVRAERREKFGGGMVVAKHEALRAAMVADGAEAGALPEALKGRAINDAVVAFKTSVAGGADDDTWHRYVDAHTAEEVQTAIHTFVQGQFFAQSPH